jgi:aromatic ring-cleaving dioxygenase
LTVKLIHLSIVPELRIYRVWDRPIGPHPVAMFEVNIFTPGTDIFLDRVVMDTD